MKFDSVPVSENVTAEKILAELDENNKQRTAFIITFVNPHSYFMVKNNPQYQNMLTHFDKVLCDGIGVVKAARLLGKAIPERLSFDATSLAPPVLSWAEENEKKVYIVGGKEGVALDAEKILKKQYPAINIAGVHSGYISDEATLQREIIVSEIDLLICGMGAPKQEAFLVGLKEAGWNGVGFTCGGFLDQIENGMQYYPEIIDKLNLRFLYRLYKEPGRLWRRYLIEYFPFVTCFLKEYFSLAVNSRFS